MHAANKKVASLAEMPKTLLNYAGRINRINHTSEVGCGNRSGFYHKYILRSQIIYGDPVETLGHIPEIIRI